MNTNKNPRELTIDLLPRSTCAVQVAAVIADKHGIHSWGWNSVGPSGFGMHAEHHALIRANRKRLKRSTLYVTSARTRRKGSWPNPILSKPCAECESMIRAYGVRHVIYSDNKMNWNEMFL